MKRTVAFLSCAVVLAACTDAPPTAVDSASPAGRPLRDEVVGVSLAVPAEWRVQQDPVLFNTYGFALFDPAGSKTGRARALARRAHLPGVPGHGLSRWRDWWTS